ncbi:MAG: cupin domain-containing protein [Gammaproteobacteria bacterium]
MTNNKTFPVLGRISAEQFLRDYWQKQPLLIRDAIPGYTTPVSPDELAGLACEAEIESRIVLEHKNSEQVLPWELRHGPFDEESFAGLPASHWTLLVQECNKYVPELALLLDQFNFIPGWRVDDVMVSYAVPGGSVGPHVDQYDVFLLQGLGQRRWQIDPQTTAGHQPGEIPDFLPNAELRILRQFEAQQEWVLNPGDILYLPPGVAHHGVALDECMTMSVGFRAPSHYDLLTAFADDRFARVTDPFRIARYTDPDLSLQENSGQISDQALQRVVEIIQSYTREPQTIRRWFGQFITEPKHEFETLVPQTTYTPTRLQAALQSHDVVHRSESAKYAFIAQSPETTYLYVNSVEFTLSHDQQALAPLVCNRRQISSQRLLPFMNTDNTGDIVTRLFNEGYLFFDVQ